MRPSRGRFITLEGGEGAGKSTQAERLAGGLRDCGLSCIITREPGGSAGAEAVRQALVSGAFARLGPAGEALMFSAARIDHLERLIRPALAAGTWVVCDRFADSTRAYQGVLGNLDRDFIAGLERLVVGDTVPDLTVLIDVPAATGLARAAARRPAATPADRFEREAPAFHQALRQAFLDIAAAEPGRCVVVDGSGRRDAVAVAIWRAVQERLLAAETPARSPAPMPR